MYLLQPTHAPQYYKIILATSYNLGCQQFHKASREINFPGDHSKSWWSWQII